MRIVGVLLFLASSLSAGITQPIRVDGGLVAGVPGRSDSGKDGAIAVFKGIPFAAPPVGDLRWRAPQRVIPWQGTRKADQFRASCMQNIVAELKPWTYEYMTHNDVSEDCLFLNVWTPAKSAGEKLPVYIYIYGGGNTSGSGAVPLYDGEGLAKKGIVVVTVNYRLGVLGFFTHPELTAESSVHASGNYALLDLIAGLHWVHDNIAAFGGNPGQVVIGGQSAGASNVHSLIASPLAKGLFHGAIAQSGSSVTGLGLMNTRPLVDQEQMGVKFAEAKGAHSLADLRKLSWKDLTTPVAGTPPIRFLVVVDGYVQVPGTMNDVPTLTGWNKDESGAQPHPTATADSFQKQARQRYADLADEFLSLYPASSDEQALTAQNESARDSARASMYLWTVARAKVAKTKAFTYYWDHTQPGPESDKYGAFHSSEIGYVMHTLSTSDRPYADADRKIEETMSAYWANFIRTGDPNGKGLPHWPSAAEQPGMTMEVGDKTVPIPVTGDKTKLAFYEKYFGSPRR